MNTQGTFHPFATALLAWFNVNKRDLPWRHTHDAYAIWLSEVILQQTRIAQGTAYWLRFMRAYPTVEALAAASEDDVLRLWQGLGYYSRGRNLHKAAQQIVEMGHFPDEMGEICKLKGVGPYTAAAIASFAFGLPVAAIDGNAFRVMARYFGISTPINTTGGRHTFEALGNELVPATRSADYNQAVMDFGATLCTPTSPSCPACPLMEGCQALRSGRVNDLPVKLKTVKVKERHMALIYIRYKDQTAICRRTGNDIWQGLWQPLLIEGSEMPAFSGRLTLLRSQVRHVLTHRVILADFYLLQSGTRPTLPEGYIWIQESELGHYALPRLVQKLVEDVRKETLKHQTI